MQRCMNLVIGPHLWLVAFTHHKNTTLSATNFDMMLLNPLAFCCLSCLANAIALHIYHLCKCPASGHLEVLGAQVARVA